MRKYKAVVFDFKRFYKGAALALLSVAMTVGIFLAFKNSVLTSDSNFSDIIKGGMPIVAESEHFDILGNISNSFKEIAKFTIGFFPTESDSVLSSAMPICKALSENSLYGKTNENNKLKEGKTTEIYDDKELTTTSKKSDKGENIPAENRAQIKTIDAKQKINNGLPVAIGNETSYGVDVDGMLKSKPLISVQKGEPVVLITHTHATESYAVDGAEYYDITASDRSESENENVIAVGNKMAEVLEKHGIKTIHDKILHDVPSFNGSYAHSLNTVTEYKNKYPSIQVVFDIHRDSIVYDDNTKAKTLTEINGKKAAQLMFVVGTDEKGLYNPDWRNNLIAAIHFQNEICKKYPSLMRHINLRKERFNGHTSNASMIIEVGTSGNSLNEALCGIEYATNCIADYLNSL